MFSRIRGSTKKSDVKEKSECKCVSVAINEKQDEENVKVVDIVCSSHPGFCVLDDSGLCTKRESAPHCSVSPVEFIGEIGTTDSTNNLSKTVDLCNGKYCGKKFHSYKIDLNNAEDTGLLADKQCQTCSPLCSPAACRSRSREFFISWDKRRTKLLICLIFAFVIWICIYVTVTASVSTAS